MIEKTNAKDYSETSQGGNKVIYIENKSDDHGDQEKKFYRK